MFGGLLIERDGRPLPPIPSRTGRSLFAYLVTHRATAPTRDLLAGRFWPDLPEPQARRRLSQALWQIQSVLGDRDPHHAFLATSLDAVRFDASVELWLDVDAFEDAVTAIKADAVANAQEIRSLEAAVDLYRGDYLAGFYDDWVLIEQERLRERYFGALGHLTRLHKSRGDFAAGLLYARRLALQDPLREEAHREVMRLCFLLGRNNEALQQYERCEAVLQEELGALPDAETRSLYDHIAAQRATQHHPAADQRPARLFEARGRIPLVGRDAERRAVVARMERAIAGDGGLVLIEGEAGVGKTRLLEEIAEDAHWRGMQVLWGRAEPAARTAFGVVADALESGMSPLRAEQLRERMADVWLTELGRLTPTLAGWLGTDQPLEARLRPAEEASRMLEAIRAGLGSLADVTPALVVLDDVQWADEDSLRALEHLAMTGMPSGLLTAVAYRRTEARDRPMLWNLLRAVDTRAERMRISIDALGSAETAELVHHAAPQGVPHPVIGRIHDETGGNPFFVLETLRAVHERRVGDAVAGRVTEADALPVPGSVANLIADRLASLTPEANKVIAALAVLERNADLDTVRLTAAIERSTLLQSVDELMSRAVVFDDRGVFRFGHDQVRRVVLSKIEPTERRDLHRAAGAALEATRPDAAEALAFHYMGAGDDARAVLYLEIAGGRAVERRAYDGAAEHFEAAADRAADPVHRAHLLLELEAVADVLARRSVQERALDAIRELGIDDPDVVHATAIRTAMLAATTDEFDAAISAADSAMIAAREADAPDRIASALAALGTIAMLAGRTEDAIEHLRGARSATSGEDAADVELNLGKALAARQQYDDARRGLQSAADLAAAQDDHRTVVEALGSLAVVEMETGNLDRARRLYGESSRLSQQIGYRYGEGRASVNLGNLEYLAGDPGAAIDAYATAAAIFEEIGNRRGAAMVHGNLASLRHEILGEDDAAAADSTRALGYFREIGDAAGVAQALDVQAGIALRRSRPRDAAALLDDAEAALRTAPDAWLHVQILLTRVRVQIALGELTAATAVLDEAQEISDRNGIGEFDAKVRILRAVAAFSREDASAAADLAGSVAATDPHDGFHAAYVLWKSSVMLDRCDEAAAALVAAERSLRELLPDVDRSSGVPEHREVLAAVAEQQPERITVRLARLAAPRGRALRKEETVPVTWTIADRSDAATPSGVERRRARLLRLLGEAAAAGAVPTVTDLATALSVSPATIRRDLAHLRASGHEAVTRGSGR